MIAVGALLRLPLVLGLQQRLSCGGAEWISVGVLRSRVSGRR